MRDLKLDEDGDLEIKEFDLKLTSDFEIVKQRLRQALLTFKGEWFLDSETGVPYFERILGESGSSSLIRAIFVDRIKKVRGVRELTDLKCEYENDNRTMSVSFSVVDEFNNLIELRI